MLKITNPLKFFISITIDIAAAAFCSLLALWIRLGDQLDLYTLDFYISQTLLMLVASLLANVLMGIYKGSWRFFNSASLARIIKYSVATSIFFYMLVLTNPNVMGYPRSAVIINIFLITTLSAIPRILYRSFFERIYKPIQDLPKVNILIIGFDRSTEIFLKELKNLADINYRIVGILDDNLSKGRTVNDISVIGRTKELKQVVEKMKKSDAPKRILVSPEFNMAGKLKNIVKQSEELSIPISSFPKLSDIDNKFGIKPIKSIPLEDLLRRPQHRQNYENIGYLVKDKTIMITGAGGSIGSEISRQIAGASPKRIVLLDNSEYLLYEIEQEIKSDFPNVPVTILLNDIRDSELLNKNISLYQPQIIFHAAALKHVPMVEGHQEEAVKTNIIGTNNVLKAAAQAGVEKFVMISTDKAVQPSSFMGATKRIAESICYMNSSENMQISVVRFGNVLGSNGSVVPIFERQIAKGGPITVTHKSATRYFMTIREAVILVLQSSFLQQNNFEVFILDMGEPVKIYDLAENMIRIAGLVPQKDIAIEIIGLRPGEKLHEELCYNYEKLEKTKLDSINRLSTGNFAKELSTDFIKKAVNAIDANDLIAIKSLACQLIMNSKIDN